MGDDHDRGGDDGPRGGRGHDGRRDRGGRRADGPPGSEFLDLEMSKVIFSGASELTVDCARDLLREAIRERLRERLGERFAAVGRLAADEFVNDVEANLDIEARILRRGEERAQLEDKLAAAFAQPAPIAKKTRATPALRKPPPSRRKRH